MGAAELLGVPDVVKFGRYQDYADSGRRRSELTSQYKYSIYEPYGDYQNVDHELTASAMS